MLSTKLLDELKDKGRAWIRNALSETELQALEKLVDLNSSAGKRFQLNDKDRSNIETSNWFEYMQSSEQHYRIARVLGFNKADDQNWALPWHQDRVVAVKKKAELPGFDNWTTKSGIPHCEPPLELFHKMLFLRVHLDDCDKSNGAMQIALASHKFGKIASSSAQAIADQCELEYTEAKRGDLLILDMLLLHKSSISQSKNPRRVIRIDVSSNDLPKPLEWA